MHTYKHMCVCILWNDNSCKEKRKFSGNCMDIEKIISSERSTEGHETYIICPLSSAVPSSKTSDMSIQHGVTADTRNV